MTETQTKNRKGIKRRRKDNLIGRQREVGSAFLPVGVDDSVQRANDDTPQRDLSPDTAV